MNNNGDTTHSEPVKNQPNYQPDNLADAIQLLIQRLRENNPIQ